LGYLLWRLVLASTHSTGAAMKFRLRLFPPLKRLKKYALLLALLLLVKIPWALMLSEDGAQVLSGATKTELLARRDYLLERVRLQSHAVAGAPAYLDSQFQGEWALVTYSMLASALTNLGFMFPETRSESLQALEELIERVRTPEMRRFDEARWGEDPLASLDSNNGHIGYLGHLNWMLSAHVLLGGDTRYSALFSSVTNALYRRLHASPGLCLETYPGEIYLPDNLVVFASIANFSRTQHGEYTDLASAWVQHARAALLDRELGILPFHLDQDCKPTGGVRGSGAGWNSFYLPYINEPFATEQYQRINQNLIQWRLFTGVREYPRGVFGLGDVDSGPALLGFSPSGTGFFIAGAAHAQDAALLTKLLFTSELVGSTWEWNARRRYLLAPLVGDAILLAMKTARVWDLRYRQ
jgi:hypothetical protein